MYSQCIKTVRCHRHCTVEGIHSWCQSRNLD